MNEKYVTICNGLLYYLIAPCLLLYFITIDMGLTSCSLTILAVFGMLIVIGAAIPMIYKKKNAYYKFDVNNMYSKVMSVLVIWELAYNFYK
jgi:prepilin signal peptidase PulO-like enzyme (type II secretory pathway)